MSRIIYLFFSKRSAFNMRILQIIQIYNLTSIRKVDYDRIVNDNRLDIIPEEITDIPGLAIYENNNLIAVVNGKEVFHFIKKYFRLDEISTPPEISKKKEIPKNDNRGKINRMNKHDRGKYFKSLHENIKTTISTSEGKNYPNFIDREASRMVPEIGNFQFVNYKDAENRKDNFLMNGTVQSNIYAKADPRNKKLFSKPSNSIINHIKTLPRDRSVTDRYKPTAQEGGLDGRGPEKNPQKRYYI